MRFDMSDPLIQRLREQAWEAVKTHLHETRPPSGTTNGMADAASDVWATQIERLAAENERLRARIAELEAS